MCSLTLYIVESPSNVELSCIPKGFSKFKSDLFYSENRQKFSIIIFVLLQKVNIATINETKYLKVCWNTNCTEYLLLKCLTSPLLCVNIYHNILYLAIAKKQLSNTAIVEHIHNLRTKYISIPNYFQSKFDAPVKIKEKNQTHCPVKINQQ